MPSMLHIIVSCLLSWYFSIPVSESLLLTVLSFTTSLTVTAPLTVVAAFSLFVCTLHKKTAVKINSTDFDVSIHFEGQWSRLWLWLWLWLAWSCSVDKHLYSVPWSLYIFSRYCCFIWTYCYCFNSVHCHFYCWLFVKSIRSVLLKQTCRIGSGGVYKYLKMTFRSRR